MIRRRETALFFKDFQIPDPVPIPSLGRDAGKKKTNTDWVWKKRGLRITNPRISYLAHDSSQNPAKSHFANFLVVSGSWCSRRHFQVSAWATVVVGRSTWAKTWTQWTGTRTRKQGTKPVLARTQQKQMNSSMRGDFWKISNSPSLSPMEHANAVWRSTTRWTESKSRQVQAVSSRQLYAEMGGLDRSRIALLPGQVDRIWKRRGISSVGVKTIMPVGSTR